MIGPFCTSQFNTSFFLPPPINAAQPSDSTLFLHRLTTMKVAVTSFPGYSTQAKVEKHAAQLASALKENNVDFKTNNYALANYDSPFRVFNRHNEIWMFLNQQ